MADTLCLSCAKCYGDCPWSERDPETKRIKFQPVPGWTAEATWKRGCGASYHVLACPLYVSDGKDYAAGRGQKPGPLAAAPHTAAPAASASAHTPTAANFFRPPLFNVITNMPHVSFQTRFVSVLFHLDEAWTSFIPCQRLFSLL